jgi:hypothetical protein
LYIVPSQKKWHGESTWVTVLPWKVMPSCSDEKPQRRSAWNRTGMFSAPGMSAAHGHVVVDRSISPGTAISHAHDTLLPWRTARDAASRTSSVMWFSVPNSSSSPHRPQFDSLSKYPSTSSCVGIGRPAVIPASTPPVTRLEARYSSPHRKVPMLVGRGRSGAFPTPRGDHRFHHALTDAAVDMPPAQRQAQHLLGHGRCEPLGSQHRPHLRDVGGIRAFLPALTFGLVAGPQQGLQRQMVLGEPAGVLGGGRRYADVLQGDPQHEHVDYGAEVRAGAGDHQPLHGLVVAELGDDVDEHRGH